MRQRILTGLIGGTIFLGFVWLGGFWFILLILVVALGAFFEYVRMRGVEWYRPSSLVGALLLIYFLDFGFKNLSPNSFYAIWMVAFLLLLASVLSKNQTSVLDVSYIFLGAFYIGMGFHAMFLIRQMPLGLPLTLYTIALVWLTDSGAYFMGRFFGKHKLWPSISPKKTIEGAVGGIAVAVVGSLLIYRLIDPQITSWDAFFIAVLISLVSMVGDMIESAIKRNFKVKDSGWILPGHGGFFDRFDSMIVAFPTMLWLLHVL
ncbi:Phosphatidate cytidylyltransferase [[Clostridium] ultunense Esp]|nr:Phosphatidate cytidylyltransferase [[Clostridium] ultunense Esp]